MLFSSTNSTQHGELLITFCNGNSAQNSSVGNQYGSQKITNLWLINMTVLSKFVDVIKSRAPSNEYKF